ncbi:peptidase [Desulfonema ishimotonii]|uniref:Peptidase n=1 Tax=Desulfonema ishimotonii TaxID=45657 RepID=A0A401FWF4_9BACT|nr:zinc metallopeptidase [Desulfonema ishimotonii]GBC61305.1 peptidase [Desulfonema ishimotonii]
MIYLIAIILIIVMIYGPQFWSKYILAKYSRAEYFSGNGLELARILADRLALSDIRVEETELGDHYDPVEKAVRLSREHCGRRSLTAVVVAAHELGHALQDRENYQPLHLRTRWVMAAYRAERIGAALMIALPLITAMTRIPAAGLMMFLAGLASLGIPVLIHLLTLPVEWDASFNRALPILASGEYIPEEDLPAARRILTACALTYVAGALASLLNLWRWLRVLRR